jgi:hypothetical protein
MTNHEEVDLIDGILGLGPTNSDTPNFVNSMLEQD